MNNNAHNTLTLEIETFLSYNSSVSNREGSSHPKKMNINSPHSNRHYAQTKHVLFCMTGRFWMYNDVFDGRWEFFSNILAAVYFSYSCDLIDSMNLFDIFDILTHHSRKYNRWNTYFFK